MKRLFDENLSHKLVSRLQAEFPGSEHVRNVGLKSADDSVVWEYARLHGFAIVSKDADFEQRSLTYGHPPKAVWLQVGNGPTSAVERLLRSHLSDLAAFGADPATALLVLA